MKAPIVFTAALAGLFSGVLSAADPQLLNLVMPDVKVMADINLAQAKNSPFGQYVLSQVPQQQLAMIVAMTSFDPSKDISELLVAGNNTTKQSGLALALGTFNVTAISGLIAQQKMPSETYHGMTIFEDPEKKNGLAFVSGSVVAAGDLVNLKAAIDRVSASSTLPAAVVAEIGQLSAANDIWILSTVPPASLANAPSISGLGLGLGNGAQNALASVLSLSAGIKFGADVVATVQAQTDTAQNAEGITGIVQFLVNMAQMKGQQDPTVQSLTKALTVSSNGTTVNLALSLPSAQFQEMIQSKTGAQHHAHQ